MINSRSTLLTCYGIEEGSSIEGEANGNSMAKPSSASKLSNANSNYRYRTHPAILANIPLSQSPVLSYADQKHHKPESIYDIDDNNIKLEGESARESGGRRIMKSEDDHLLAINDCQLIENRQPVASESNGLAVEADRKLDRFTEQDGERLFISCLSSRIQSKSAGSKNEIMDQNIGTNLSEITSNEDNNMLIGLQLDSLIGQYLDENDKINLSYYLNQYETNECDLSELLTNLLHKLLIKLPNPMIKYKLLDYIKKLYVKPKELEQQEQNNLAFEQQQQQQQHIYSNCSINESREGEGEEFKQQQFRWKLSTNKNQLDLRLYEAMIRRYLIASNVLIYNQLLMDNNNNSTSSKTRSIAEQQKRRRQRRAIELQQQQHLQLQQRQSSSSSGSILPDSVRNLSGSSKCLARTENSLGYHSESGSETLLEATIGQQNSALETNFLNNNQNYLTSHSNNTKPLKIASFRSNYKQQQDQNNHNNYHYHHQIDGQSTPTNTTDASDTTQTSNKLNRVANSFSKPLLMERTVDVGDDSYYQWLSPPPPLTSSSAAVAAVLIDNQQQNYLLPNNNHHHHHQNASHFSNLGSRQVTRFSDEGLGGRLVESTSLDSLNFNNRLDHKTNWTTQPANNNGLCLEEEENLRLQNQSNNEPFFSSLPFALSNNATNPNYYSSFASNHFRSADVQKSDEVSFYSDRRRRRRRRRFRDFQGSLPELNCDFYPDSVELHEQGDGAGFLSSNSPLQSVLQSGRRLQPEHNSSYLNWTDNEDRKQDEFDGDYPLTEFGGAFSGERNNTIKLCANNNNNNTNVTNELSSNFNEAQFYDPSSPPNAFSKQPTRWNSNELLLLEQAPTNKHQHRLRAWSLSSPLSQAYTCHPISRQHQPSIVTLRQSPPTESARTIISSSHHNIMNGTHKQDKTKLLPLDPIGSYGATTTFADPSTRDQNYHWRQAPSSLPSTVDYSTSSDLGFSRASSSSLAYQQQQQQQQRSFQQHTNFLQKQQQQQQLHSNRWLQFANNNNIYLNNNSKCDNRCCYSSMSVPSDALLPPSFVAETQPQPMLSDGANSAAGEQWRRRAGSYLEPQLCYQQNNQSVGGPEQAKFITAAAKENQQWFQDQRQQSSSFQLYNYKNKPLVVQPQTQTTATSLPSSPFAHDKFGAHNSVGGHNHHHHHRHQSQHQEPQPQQCVKAPSSHRSRRHASRHLSSSRHSSPHHNHHHQQQQQQPIQLKDYQHHKQKHQKQLNHYNSGDDDYEESDDASGSLLVVPSQARGRLPMSVAEQMKQQANTFVHQYGSSSKTHHRSSSSSSSNHRQSNQKPNLQVRRTLRVKIKKSKPILGIAIEGGFNVSGQLLPRIVCVHEDGAAYQCGKLRASDLILEVNGQSTVNMTHDEIAKTIATAYYQDPNPYIEFLIGESIHV